MAARLQRRRPTKGANRLYLVVSEGVVTEPSYFREFCREERVHGVSVKVVGAGTDPVGVVDQAIRLLAENAKQAKAGNAARYDECWVLFDVDDFGRDQIDTAKRNARRLQIKVAVSNPCFELWLVLHYSDQNAHCSSAKIQKTMRSIDAEYQKSVNYKALGSGRDDALRRAEALEAMHEREDGCGNPSTAVWRLVGRLLGKKTEDPA